MELGAGGGQSAFAASMLGHNVVAIELLAPLADNGKKLMSENTNGSLKVIQGDFYTVELNQVFDVVVYWDGFGIGTDQDQRKLLKRIYNWLKPEGCALIDIYTPWNAAFQNGREMKMKNAQRRYGFNAEECRWLDLWWEIGNENNAVTQSLRCYSPADLKLLLEGTGLELTNLIPSGYYDYEKKVWFETKDTPLEKSIWYAAKLEKKDKLDK